MKAILTALAIFQIRWAVADFARTERLSDEADAALDRAVARRRVTEGLARRADLGAMLDTRR
ncbi:hypothetical protein MKK70_13395 [Methylobacterium sp. E-041]|uniref:hypothetical protein n=1 Tax=unclassified Methylobacterium TaxID=2615210 RepID=UPI001FB9200E|nr:MULTISPECIES: hypothetical protein [unclassified Methylobacterium]MCJ2038143.1 hypothetical protein [Methylobacterium sp. J-059]MCJ2106359.1 hypothetical protein [Methylobacterium sp. E-041]